MEERCLIFFSQIAVMGRFAIFFSFITFKKRVVRIQKIIVVELLVSTDRTISEKVTKFLVIYFVSTVSFMSPVNTNVSVLIKSKLINNIY